jgi:GTP-binding protein
VPKSRSKKSAPKPRSLKQRKGPSSNRRHGKSLRAVEQAKRARRTVKPPRGITAAAQRRPPTAGDTFSDLHSTPVEPIHFAPPAHTNIAAAPLIAIVGRPNVGKSTLFNRLAGSRRSIVGDEPGITRDRIYGTTDWEGRTARIVDTGGIIPDEEALIPAEIFRQARVALDEASAIVMVVDGRTELAAPDLELARRLIRTGKPLFLAVNKVDTAAMEDYAHSFRTLGISKLIPISAEHGHGIGDLLEAVFAVLPEPAPELAPAPDSDISEPAPDAAATELHDQAAGYTPIRTHGAYEQHEVRVAIIGRPNVGKSTLLNALTGNDRAIVSPVAGTTRDAVDEAVTINGTEFRFIDTAGIRRKGKTKLMAEKLSVVMARKHLEAADVAVLVIDAVEGVTALDATIGGYAHESGRSVVIAVNKWDLVGPARKDGKPPADIDIYTERLRYSLKFLEYAPVIFISALDASGHAKHINKLVKEIAIVAAARRKRVTTGQMNRFLARVDFQRASVPMSRRMRIFYMTQAAVAPPTFVLFTDRAVELHFGFRRFLENQIRAAFGFPGSPIWFKVRARNKKNAHEKE